MPPKHVYSLSMKYILTVQQLRGCQTLEESIESIKAVEPNLDVTEVMANIIIKEQANIVIHSNLRCNPSSPNYNMRIPPATYDEVMKRPDHTLWFSVMKVEL